MVTNASAPSLANAHLDLADLLARAVVVGAPDGEPPPDRRVLERLPERELDLGPGRIVASEPEAPTMLASRSWCEVDERQHKATTRPSPGSTSAA